MLFNIRHQPQRFSRIFAKTDIRKIFEFADRDDYCRVVKLTPEISSVKNSGRNKSGLKADLTQQLIEKSVKLVAKTASPPRHDLFIKPCGIQYYRPFPMNVEVFERDAQQVLPLQQPQALRVWRNRPVDPDPL